MLKHVISKVLVFACRFAKTFFWVVHVDVVFKNGLRKNNNFFGYVKLRASQSFAFLFETNRLLKGINLVTSVE